MRVELPTASVDLGCAWRWHPSALRGAVLDGLPGPVHSDWNGRLNEGEGETLSRLAPVYYRVDGDRARLWLWGERTPERVAELGRVASLQTPDGGRVPVTMSVDLGAGAFALTGKHWYRYRLASPWWPPGRAWARAPHGASDAIWRAWLGDGLLSGLHGVLRAVGVTSETCRPSVQVEQFARRPVVWHRDGRDLHHDGVGFLVEFVSNMLIPAGFALGKHVAEGYGEVRC